ncbi:MAG: MFS transporter [Planctomycetes bacterium]|nr:MFS transporter [Planctomycetota bacterium]MDP6409957.1 MFS transporter [Planctomycetota bacterium]
MPRSLQRRLFGIEPGETACVLWAAATFFCALSGYYVLRPLRDAFGIAEGLRNLKWLYLVTFVVMLVVSPIFALLVARFPRRRVVPWVCHCFAANLLVFSAALGVLPGEWSTRVGSVFFSWTSVYNLIVVSVTWSLVIDLFSVAQSRRLFGLVIAGGSAGAVCGAALTAILVSALGPAPLLLVTAGMLEAQVLCIAGLRRAFARRETEEPKLRERSLGGGWLEGWRRVRHSPYLLAICGYMLLTSICASVAYYERSAVVAAAAIDSAERARLFASMDVVSNVLILGLQAFAASRLLAWIGVGATLCILPALYLLGFCAIGGAPVLAVIVVFEVARRSVGYGVTAPTKEVLYSPLPPVEQYKAKHFIDTAVWRGGDLLGVWLASLLDLLSGLGTLTLAAVPFAAAWLAVARRIGRDPRLRRGGGGGAAGSASEDA